MREIDDFRLQIYARKEGLAREGPYFTQRVFQVVPHEFIPAQIRQLILYISNDEG